MISDKAPLRKSFTTWLKDQLTRDDEIGELSRGALADPDWPETGDLQVFEFYLTYCNQGAGTAYGTHEGLRQAWHECQPGSIEVEADLVAEGIRSGCVAMMPLGRSPSQA